MQFAVVSDIHANSQAWKAVLLDIRSFGLDKIICLGDIVGYGASPAEVLQSVHANVDHFVLGNHDAVVCGKMDVSLFNAGAGRIIEWTRAHLNAQAARFLRSLPLSLEGRAFRCAHGEFAEPAAFNYVIDPEDAMPSWRAVPHQLLFVGHTHRPAIFVLGASGQPHMVPPQDFALEEGKRYLVNVASVGQPRDGQALAGYCIYDTEAASVCWRRIPFDIDAYRETLRAAGVPVEASYFLRHDPREGAPLLREILNFSPAATPEQAVRDAVEVQDIEALRRRVTRWKVLAAAALGAGLVAAAAAGAAWWRHGTRGLVLAEPALAPIPSVAVRAESNILPVPPPAAPAGGVVPGWRIVLGDRRRQSVSVAGGDGAGPVFRLESSSSRDQLRLESAPVLVRPGQKMCAEGLFRRGEGFAGAVALVVSLTREGADGPERVDQFVVKEPNLPRQGGWLQAKNTFDVPARATAVSVQVRGRFTGDLDVSGLSLIRKE
ncbi:MAG: metallophosphoesterase family protein [Lentisphaerae bacterium]|nr:metallophosphoesterase family protein [Lentisphaerota bacterium]